jgi:hypothetical protein
MAPRRKEESQTNGSGKGTFRFRYMDSNRQFEVQADNVSGESLLEGFRQVASAIAGRAPAVEPARRLPKDAAAGAAAEVLDEKDDTEIDVLPFPDQSAAEAEEKTVEESSDAAGERKHRPAPRAPKFLDDLNLTTATVSLEDFVKQKNPDNDLDKYAVIAVWYKQHFNTGEISIDHIFTAYKTLGWQAQMPGPDPSQTLRNLKNNKNWLTAGSKRGFFKVNWHCEDTVNKMNQP